MLEYTNKNIIRRSQYGTQHASKFGKLNLGHRTGKGQFSFQSQRKAMPKNAETTAQLHSSHTLAKYCSNSPRQASMVCELPDIQAGIRKGGGSRDQIANIHWIIKKASKFQKNIYFCFIDYAKVFNCVQFSSIAQSCPTLCPHEPEHNRFPCPSTTP